MTALPDVALTEENAAGTAGASAMTSSVVRRITVRVWWVVCLLPALVLLAVAAGR
jgi:hypothetical protein